MYSKKYGSVTIIHTTMEVFTVYTNLDMKEPLCAECRTCKALPLSYIVQSLLFLVRPVYRPGFGKKYARIPSVPSFSTSFLFSSPS